MIYEALHDQEIGPFCCAMHMLFSHHIAFVFITVSLQWYILDRLELRQCCKHHLEFKRAPVVKFGMSQAVAHLRTTYYSNGVTFHPCLCAQR